MKWISPKLKELLRQSAPQFLVVSVLSEDICRIVNPAELASLLMWIDLHRPTGSMHIGPCQETRVRRAGGCEQRTTTNS
eukprot:7762216-Heterocapsa_arctica.AAC.1